MQFCPNGHYTAARGEFQSIKPLSIEMVDQTTANLFDGWSGISLAEQLNTDLAENPDLVVIDGRRTEELEEKGIVEAANFIHIPLEEFVAQKELWPADKSTPIGIYCGSGHRSTMAMTILWSYGYEDVRSLKGGFGGWVESGYPAVEYEVMSS